MRAPCWTADEIATLEAYWRDPKGETVTEFASRLGRTPNAISYRASVLGLGNKYGDMRSRVVRRAGQPRGPARRVSDPVIGKLIEARVARGMSLLELEKRVGYDRGSFWRWEHERTRPNEAQLRDWAQALNVTLTI